MNVSNEQRGRRSKGNFSLPRPVEQVTGTFAVRQADRCVSSMQTKGLTIAFVSDGPGPLSAPSGRRVASLFWSPRLACGLQPLREAQNHSLEADWKQLDTAT